MTDNILQARQVIKRFGGLLATNHFDYELPRNTIASIIGPNGAGENNLL